MNRTTRYTVVAFTTTLLLAWTVTVCNAAEHTPAGFTCVDPLVKVFRSATNLPTTTAEAHVAVGEYATIQFVFRTPVDVTNLTAAVAGDVPGAVARFVGYVKVGKRCCNELWSDDGKFPDPLLEDKRIAVAANQNQPVWITVPTNTPGTFCGTLVIRWDGGVLRCPFQVHVHNVRMKKTRLWVTNWWFSDSERLALLAGHKVEPFSDEYWRRIRQFADFMAAYHQNVVLISPLDLTQISQKDSRWSFDFTRFDKTVETFIAAGVVGRIEGGHIGGRASEDWNSPFVIRVPQAVGGFISLPVTNAATRAFYEQFFPALARHLAERGWDKIYLQHLADEPITKNAASYRQIADLVHEFAPKMRVIEATQTRELVGAVNTWVPVLDHLHRDYDFMRARQKAGDEVWTYTCCGPGGSYANRFIEQQLLKPRLLHWINFRYGVTGYLHWGFNYWNIGTSPFDETTFKLPGGDQWIVYPRNGQLLSSIRLEAMRDGIGDYELLSMLAERDSVLAQKLATETILDFNRYDTDIARFRTRRLQLLECVRDNFDWRDLRGLGKLLGSMCFGSQSQARSVA
jgi:hypothetical protein